MKEVLHKLHVSLDQDSMKRLNGLKEHLGAPTDTEIVRRAIRAYEAFEPTAGVDDSPLGSAPNRLTPLYGVNMCFRLPIKMFERMDVRKGVTGESYAQQIRQGLRVLTQLQREFDSHLGQLSSRLRLTGGV